MRPSIASRQKSSGIMCQIGLQKLPDGCLSIYNISVGRDNRGMGKARFDEGNLFVRQECARQIEKCQPASNRCQRVKVRLGYGCMGQGKH